MLNDDLVTLDFTTENAEGAILTVAQPLKNSLAVADFEMFCSELLKRERLSSTAVGSEAAFPHARTQAVRQIVMSFGRIKDGVRFTNGELVRFIVVIGVPPDKVREYLALLGKIARLFKDATVLARLAAAQTPAEFLEPLTVLEKA